MAHLYVTYTNIDESSMSNGVILQSVLAIVRWLVPLATGIIIGFVIFASFSAKGATGYSSLVSFAAGGIVFSLAVYLLLQGVRIAIRTQVRRATTGALNPYLRDVMTRGLGRAVSDAEAQDAANKVARTVEAWLLGISTFALLGLAVTLCGTLVILGQTLAAYQQVERLDKQNELLDRQLKSGEASEARTAYWSQLDALTTAIGEHQKVPNMTRIRARISAVIVTTRDYRVVPGIDGPISPERGQLLALLLSEGLGILVDRYDFSRSDLSDQVISREGEGRTAIYSTGAIDLRFSDWREARIGGIDFSAADLRGAVLPPAESFDVYRSVRPQDRASFSAGLPPFVPSGTMGAGRHLDELVPTERQPSERDHIFGADLRDAVVPDERWLDQMMRRIGPNNIEFSLWKVVRTDSRFKLQLDEASVALNAWIAKRPRSCTRAPSDREARLPDVREIVTLINAQAAPHRTMSKEKGYLIASHPNDEVVCLQRAGANLRNAYLGFRRLGLPLSVQSLDVSQASFASGQALTLDARGARLPSPGAFDFYEVQDHEGALQLDGALVGSADWLDQFAQRIRLGRSSLAKVCSERVSGICSIYASYRLQPVAGASEFQVVVSSASKDGAPL